MEAYDILLEVDRNPEARVLATVIYVEGHAYRKQGALMLLMADGSSLGSISPGCLEADLSAYLPIVWESQKPQMVEYDMRPADDFGWGETIGCGGLIRILLEPVTGELLVNLLVVKARLDRGEAVQFVRTFSEGYSDITYALYDHDEVSPSIRHSVYAALFTPKPRVIVFGANQDAIPLAQMAESAGFRVVVADWREDFCTMERFPGAETVVAFPEQLVSQLKPNAHDYVIVMSHQFEKDEAFLRGVMGGANLRYLGIMGSRDRTERMLEGLGRPEWLHYPVGLNIGSEGPVENAISMVAELISIKRGVNTNGEWDSPVVKGRDAQGFYTW